MKRHKRSSKRHKEKESGKQETPNNAATEKKSPLTGKKVYVDVADRQQTLSLDSKLRKLGAIIETFLSKEVNYVISATAPVQKGPGDYVEAGSPESPLFVNTPSPCTPDPIHPEKEKQIIPTRGQALAQIAMRRTRSPSPSGVVSSAIKLGIKVISVETAEKWLIKECMRLGFMKPDSAFLEARQPKVRGLNGPFLKVESTTQQYRPIYFQLPEWPTINMDTPMGTNPFDGKGVTTPRFAVRGEKDGQAASIGNEFNPGSNASLSGVPRRSLESDASLRLMGVPVLTAGDLRRQHEQKRKEAKRRGYCECCHIKYENIDKHIQKASHREFARDKQNYEKLDEVRANWLSLSDFLRNTLMKHCTRQAAASAKPISAAASFGSLADDDPQHDQVLTLDPGTPTRKESPSLTSSTAQLPKASHHPSGVASDLPGYTTPTNSPVKQSDSPAVSTKSVKSVPQPKSIPHPKFEGAAEDDAEGASRDSGIQESSSATLSAVVIRRPSMRGLGCGSPRRRFLSPSPSKRPASPARAELLRPKVTERSMIFRDSPIASLQCVDKNAKDGCVEKSDFSTLRRCSSLPIVRHRSMTKSAATTALLFNPIENDAQMVNKFVESEASKVANLQVNMSGTYLQGRNKTEKNVQVANEVVKGNNQLEKEETVKDAALGTTSIGAGVEENFQQPLPVDIEKQTTVVPLQNEEKISLQAEETAEQLVTRRKRRLSLSNETRAVRRSLRNELADSSLVVSPNASLSEETKPKENLFESSVFFDKPSSSLIANSGEETVGKEETSQCVTPQPVNTISKSANSSTSDKIHVGSPSKVTRSQTGRSSRRSDQETVENEETSQCITPAKTRSQSSDSSAPDKVQVGSPSKRTRLRAARSSSRQEDFHSPPRTVSQAAARETDSQSTVQQAETEQFHSPCRKTRSHAAGSATAVGMIFDNEELQSRKKGTGADTTRSVHQETDEEQAHSPCRKTRSKTAHVEDDEHKKNFSTNDDRKKNLSTIVQHSSEEQSPAESGEHCFEKQTCSPKGRTRSHTQDCTNKNPELETPVKTSSDPDKELKMTAVGFCTPEKPAESQSAEAESPQEQKQTFYSPWRKTRAQAAQEARWKKDKQQANASFTTIRSSPKAPAAEEKLDESCSLLEESESRCIQKDSESKSNCLQKEFESGISQTESASHSSQKEPANHSSQKEPASHSSQKEPANHSSQKEPANHSSQKECASRSSQKDSSPVHKTVQRNLPSPRRLNTPVKQLKQDDIDSERGSSPVYLRSVVHCSTPVVISTRALRNAATSLRNVVSGDLQQTELASRNSYTDSAGAITLQPLLANPTVVSEIVQDNLSEKRQSSEVALSEERQSPGVELSEKRKSSEVELSEERKSSGVADESEPVELETTRGRKAKRQSLRNSRKDVPRKSREKLDNQNSESHISRESRVTENQSQGSQVADVPDQPNRSTLADPEKPCASFLPSKPFPTTSSTPRKPQLSICVPTADSPLLHQTGSQQDASTPTTPRLFMKFVRCSLAPSPCQGRSTKKVKLNSSWQLLSDHSVSRLLQSEQEESPFKGFKGDEALPSDLTFESASEVEITDDEDRKWVIGQEDASEDESARKKSRKRKRSIQSHKKRLEFNSNVDGSKLVCTDEKQRHDQRSRVHGDKLLQEDSKQSLNSVQTEQEKKQHQGKQPRKSRQGKATTDSDKSRRSERSKPTFAADNAEHELVNNGKKLETQHGGKVTGEENLLSVTPTKSETLDDSIQELIPAFSAFSSPGKGSDSSWGDACDVYIAQTFQHRLQTLQQRRRSPRKHPESPLNKKKRTRSTSRGKSGERGDDDEPSGKRRAKGASGSQKGVSGVTPTLDVIVEGTTGFSTPTKAKGRHRVSSVKDNIDEVQVDEDILFNYVSPQKLRTVASPLRTINANVIGSLAKHSPQQSPRSSRQNSALMRAARPITFT